MNKQLIQKIVEAYNEDFALEPIYIIIESNGHYYNCYDRIVIINDVITFVDDYVKTIVLECKDIDSVKVDVI